MINFPTQVEGCNAPDPKPVYLKAGGGFECRCSICSRCKNHTGNTNQGHYWSLCDVAVKFHEERHLSKSPWNCTQCMVEFHFCCPGNCEIFKENGERRNPHQWKT